MEAIDAEDRAKSVQSLPMSTDTSQHSLGILWNLSEDAFTFKVNSEAKPFTRRGVLSTVNSLYDPLGFLAPVTIQGKLILRDLIKTNNSGWDEPLPKEFQQDWETWRESLTELELLRIPRTYVNVATEEVERVELHIYSDASEVAIAAAAYLRILDKDNTYHVGFILGKAKVAPTHGTTIPRLELCAAVLAVEIGDFVLHHLNIKPHTVLYHSDSKVVLGYVHNQTRRFKIYVANRVDRIRKSSTAAQWTYVRTDRNPADEATRPMVSCPTFSLSRDQRLTRNSSQMS